MLENPQASGLFNFGTDRARSFYDLGVSVFHALEIQPDIEFIEMPETLRAKYQYFTEAHMTKLREAEYAEEFYSLEDGVKDYVQNYLDTGAIY